MKKTLLLISLILAGFLTASGQSKLEIGVKGGMNLATQHSKDPNASAQSILGYHGGIYVNYFLTDILAVQPEALLSMKGSKWEDPVWNGKDILNYIEIPLLIRYQPFEIFNIQAGPQFSYLFLAKRIEDGSDEKEDAKEFYKNGDVGLVIGAEANLPFRINLTIRYILGLSDVAVTDPDYTYKWTNNVLQISAGFRLYGL
ncbi:MAG: PorT family protein [Bacteroidales bacterium]|nr:PorT family protein [Bacteroidales bacterium]